MGLKRDGSQYVTTQKTGKEIKLMQVFASLMLLCFAGFAIAAGYEQSTTLFALFSTIAGAAFLIAFAVGSIAAVLKWWRYS